MSVIKYLILSLLIFSCASNQKVVKKKVVKPSEQIKNQARELASKRNCNQVNKTSHQAVSAYNNSSSNNSWLVSAKCFKDKGDMNKALFYYKLGLSKDPNNSEIKSELVEYHIKSQNYSKAYDLLKSIKNIKSEINLKRLGVLENYFGHYKSSINALSKIPQVDEKKNFDEINYLQALNYLALSNYDQAYVNFEKVSMKYKMNSSRKTRYLYTLIKVDNLTKAKKIISDRGIASEGGTKWTKLVNMVNQKIASQQSAKTLARDSVKAKSQAKE